MAEELDRGLAEQARASMGPIDGNAYRAFYLLEDDRQASPIPSQRSRPQ